MPKALSTAVTGPGWKRRRTSSRHSGISMCCGQCRAHLPAFDAIAHQLGLACAHRARRKVLRQPRKPAVRIACVVGGKTSRDIDAFRARHAIAASRAGHAIRFFKLIQHVRDRVELVGSHRIRQGPIGQRPRSHPPARYRSYPKAASSPEDDSTPTKAPRRPECANAGHGRYRAQRGPAAAACPLDARPAAAPSQTPRDRAPAAAMSPAVPAW